MVWCGAVRCGVSQLFVVVFCLFLFFDMLCLVVVAVMLPVKL